MVSDWEQVEANIASQCGLSVPDFARYAFDRGFICGHNRLREETKDQIDELMVKVDFAEFERDSAFAFCRVVLGAVAVYSFSVTAFVLWLLFRA